MDAMINLLLPGTVHPNYSNFSSYLWLSIAFILPRIILSMYSLLFSSSEHAV